VEGEKYESSLDPNVLSTRCGDSEYKAIMTDFIEEARQQGIECFAFADLFLF
jgi:hypothetical protein